MPTKLTTTVSKIVSIPNSVNSELINDFYQYMKSNGASERHQNNNLKVMIAYARFLGTDVSFYNIQKKEPIIAFLDTKTKNTKAQRIGNCTCNSTTAGGNGKITKEK